MDKISARDLRVGNYIKYTTGEVGKVVAMDGLLGDIAIDQDNELLPMSEYSPIPLTPELIERCGFVEDGNFDNHSVDYYRNGCIHIQFPNYEGWDIYYVWRDNVIDEKGMRKQYDIVLKSLHQLQNLYYALTGIELDVKM